MTNYSASSISPFIHSLGFITIRCPVSVNGWNLKADRQTDNAVYCLEGYRERTLHHWDLAESLLKSEHVKHTEEVIKEKMPYSTRINHL